MLRRLIGSGFDFIFLPSLATRCAEVAVLETITRLAFCRTQGSQPVGRSRLPLSLRPRSVEI